MSDQFFQCPVEFVVRFSSTATPRTVRPPQHRRQMRHGDRGVGNIEARSGLAQHKVGKTSHSWLRNSTQRLGSPIRQKNHPAPIASIIMTNAQSGERQLRQESRLRRGSRTITSLEGGVELLIKPPATASRPRSVKQADRG